MYRDVDARRHRLAKVFPASFGATASLNEAEFMLFGAVGGPARGAAAADWAGHGQLRRDGINAPWRFVF